MPDREEKLSSYIDCLNKERKPSHSLEEGPQDWQELLVTVRMAKSLKEPAMPDHDFPRRMARHLARVLGKGGSRSVTGSRKWWWLPVAAAIMVGLLFSWQLLGQGGQSLTGHPQVALEQSPEEARPLVVPDQEQVEGRERPPAGTLKKQEPGPVEEVAPPVTEEAAGRTVEKHVMALAVGSAAAGAGPDDTQQQAGAGGEIAGQTASTGTEPPPPEAGATAGAPDSPAHQLSPPRQEDTAKQVSSRSLPGQVTTAGGLKVDINLEQAVLQQPVRFTVQLVNNTSAGLSISYPTPILVVQETGSGEPVWKAALSFGLPVFLAAREEVSAETTWPGPMRPGWYRVTVEEVYPVPTGTEEPVAVQQEPLEFFVPYPPHEIRSAGTLTAPARASREDVRVTVDGVSFSQDATRVALSIQAPEVALLDFEIAASWDGGQPQRPRKVTQETGQGTVTLTAWFNPIPTDAGSLRLQLVTTNVPPALSDKPWVFDLPLGGQPSQE